VLDLACGYGYKPMRVIATYLTAVLVFAAVYNWLGPLMDRSFSSTGWYALWLSFVAIHGRGVVSGGVAPSSQLLGIAAAEAISGLFIEAIMVATLVRWLFRE
jgi:hypothetical protein